MEKDIEEQETITALSTKANKVLTIEDDKSESDDGSSLATRELLTMANKVLTIKDDESEREDRIKSPQPSKHNELNFHEEFREHLIRLMLPGTSPLPNLNDKDLIERFEGRRIEKNGKILYQFDCLDFGGGSKSQTSHKPGQATISGPTYSAKCVLSLIRSKLKNEIWIRDNVVECHTKETKEYHYMQNLVCECLNEENSKLYNYILCLHQKFKTKT